MYLYFILVSQNVRGLEKTNFATDTVKALKTKKNNPPQVMENLCCKPIHNFTIVYIIWWFITYNKNTDAVFFYYYYFLFRHLPGNLHFLCSKKILILDDMQIYFSVILLENESVQIQRNFNDSYW